jgi:hypothetical protein
VPEALRGRVSSLDFFVSLALMPVSMAIAGPAGAAFGVTVVFLVAGILPGFLAAATILLPRLDRDELAHPRPPDKGARPSRCTPAMISQDETAHSRPEPRSYTISGQLLVSG